MIYLIWVISFWKDRTKSQLPLFQENVSQGVFLKMCCSVNKWMSWTRERKRVSDEGKWMLPLDECSCFNHWAAVELKEESAALLLLSYACLTVHTYAGRSVESMCSLFLNGMYPYRSLNWWIWDLEGLSLWSVTNIYSRSEFAFTCLPETKCLFVSISFFQLLLTFMLLWQYKTWRLCSDMTDNSKH